MFKKTIRNTAFLLCTGLLLFVSVESQTQKKQVTQEDIWNTVIAYWEAEANQDIEGYLSYVHPDYMGWPYEEALPTNRESLKKWLFFRSQTTNRVLYDIKPASIQVRSSFAIVHYYFTEVWEDISNVQQYRTGRRTDILIKDGEKWLLIGNHGGPASVN